MSAQFGTPEYWLERAEEARAMAEEFNDSQAKRAMLDIAAGYEKVASRTEVARRAPTRISD